MGQFKAEQRQGVQQSSRKGRVNRSKVLGTLPYFLKSFTKSLQYKIPMLNSNIIPQCIAIEWILFEFLSLYISRFNHYCHLYLYQVRFIHKQNSRQSAWQCSSSRLNWIQTSDSPFVKYHPGNCRMHVRKPAHSKPLCSNIPSLSSCSDKLSITSPFIMASTQHKYITNASI